MYWQNNLNLNLIMVFLNNLRTFKSAIFFIALFVLGFSCKKEDSIIGLEVQPADEQFGILYTDTITIESLSIREDSLVANTTLYNLLGSINDSVFGKTNASFYTQIILPTTNVTFSNPASCIVDSVVLALKYNGYYGNLNSQSFKVFELTDNIFTDKTYYSNTNLSYNSAETGKIENHIPDPNSPVYIGNDTLAPQLRIKLENELGKRFINADPSVFTNTTNFTTFFKGLYIQSDNPNQSINQGAILYLDLLSANSKLSIYYTENNIKKSFDFIIGQGAARINKFEHDYSNTPIEKQFQNPLFGREKVYIQSMAGIKTKLTFPHLNNLKNIAINKAELVLPIEQYNQLLPHSKLVLTSIDNEGKATAMIDALEGENYFGGLIDNAKKEYRFNIARHLHQVINQGKKDNGLFIMPVAGVINANETILKGGYPFNQMKLKITYTKL